MSKILYRLENGVARLTLNRPDVYNSFDREMAMGMQSHLNEAENDKSVRCILITGSGKAFSAGQDLKEAIDPKGPAIDEIVREHYNPIILKIRELNKPVVAAVNGVAAGAGANIALACDVVIATESASFIQAFSKIGLIPDSGGTFFLPRLIGWQRASALAMLGDKIGAADAENMGMIYKSVPDADFSETVDRICSKLAKMPTRGLAMTKHAFNQSLVNKLSIQLKVEEKLQTAASQTYDYQEGVNAFLEKRKPEFKGE